MSEHTPLTEAEREYAVQGEWLVEYVNEHTCGTGRDGYYGAHEPGCGMEPVARIADILDALAARTSTATADTGLRERVEALKADRDHWKAHAEEAGAGFTQVCRDYARATARLAEYERLIHEPMDDAEFRRRIVQHYERRAFDATPASTEDRADNEGTR